MTSLLERILWRMYVTSYGVRPLDRLADRRYWWNALHHEAGHTFVWMQRFKKPRAINCGFDVYKDLALTRHAGIKPDCDTPYHFDILGSVMVLAAGKIAEQELLGNISDGFGIDAAIMQAMFLKILRTRYDPEEQRIYNWHDFAEAHDEQEAGFPLTSKMVRQNKKVIARIAETAFAKLEALDTFALPFDTREILTIEEIEKIVNGRA